MQSNINNLLHDVNEVCVHLIRDFYVRNVTLQMSASNSKQVVLIA